MSKEPLEFTLPSSPTDRAKIKDTVYEIVALMREIKDARSFIADKKKEMKEQFQLPPKILTKMAKTYQEANFQDVVAENETFGFMFETLFENNNNATSAASTYSTDESDAE